MKKIARKSTIPTTTSGICITNFAQTPQKKSSFNLRPIKKPNLKDYVNKSYALVRSVKYEQFLEGLGVEEDTIKIVAKLKPIVVLTKNGETYNLTTNYTKQIHPRTLTFRPGEEITRQLTDGMEVKSVFEIYENKIIETQNIDGKKLTIKRKFTENELVVSMEYNGIVSQRFYASIPSRHSIETETSRRQSLMCKDLDYPVTTTPPIESVIEEILGSESDIEDLCQ